MPALNRGAALPDASRGRPLTVWILQTGEPLHIDGAGLRPMRAINLANALLAAGHRVVLWSARFNHQAKAQRQEDRPVVALSDRLELRLIPSRGYQRNVGLARLVDHAELAFNLRRVLRDITIVPDVAFVGYPPIETAAVMVRWLRRRGVPSVVDVKDQWPHLFLGALPSSVRWLGRVALWPYFFYGRQSMREATGVTAMADGFLEWALRFASRSPRPHDGVFPLTSPEGEVSPSELGEACAWWDARGVTEDGAARVMFVGTHAPTVDFQPVSEAARRLPGVRFVICGDGPESARWRATVQGLPNIVFPGWIDRARIDILARRSIAALIPYRNTDDFQRSIPNKVLDALSLGLPLLSPLEGEVTALITNHDVGLRYGGGTGRTLAECAQALVETPDLRRRLSGNARTLYQQRFSFERVYGGLVKHLEGMARRVNGDKQVERDRYERMARTAGSPVPRGAESLPIELRAPYTFYEERIAAVVGAGQDVLEIGAGTGAHTGALVRAGARVTATDISPGSLAALEGAVGPEANGRLRTQVADMEDLPFGDASFDVVASAGALSYGAPARVDAEIRRVLRRGGMFVCVDSLNHSPVYRLNRWIHYLRGDRTRSTIRRIPTLERIAALSAGFASIEVQFFGSISWLAPVLVPVIGAERVASLSDTVDRAVGVRRSAFKFVLVARGAGQARV